MIIPDRSDTVNCRSSIFHVAENYLAVNDRSDRVRFSDTRCPIRAEGNCVALGNSRFVFSNLSCVVKEFNILINCSGWSGSEDIGSTVYFNALKNTVVRMNIDDVENLKPTGNRCLNFCGN